MRRLFLWAAGNRWLKEHLPRLPFMLGTTSCSAAPGAG